MSATELTSNSVDHDPADIEVEQRKRPESKVLGLPRPHWWSVPGVARLIWPAVVFLAARELGLLVLGWMARRNKLTVDSALTAWDGQWFLGIAKGGYGGVPVGLVDAFGHRSAETPLAFFPGYPYLVRLAAALPGVDTVAAAFAVSTVSGVACAYALRRLGAAIGGSRRVGAILIVLFAASPMAIVLSMAYSEALFCALAAWALVGVVERNWVVAGLACTGAGLVRSTAAALVIAVGLAAALAIVRREDGWRPWVGALLAPVGLLGYLGWVGVRTGRWNGWLDLQQKGWDSHFDGGAATWRFSLDALASARSVLEVATVALLIVGVALLFISIRRGLPWPVVIYAVGVLVMDLGSNGLMNSKARLLLPAFTLLLPAAMALAKRKPTTVVSVLAGLLVASAWFGAYSITAWPYAI